MVQCEMWSCQIHNQILIYNCFLATLFLFSFVSWPTMKLPLYCSYFGMHMYLHSTCQCVYNPILPNAVDCPSTEGRSLNSWSATLSLLYSHIMQVTEDHLAIIQHAWKCSYLSFHPFSPETATNQHCRISLTTWLLTCTATVVMSGMGGSSKICRSEMPIYSPPTNPYHSYKILWNCRNSLKHFL